MNKKLRILLVEDSIEDLNLIEHLLKKDGLSFNSIAVETKKDYEKQLSQFKPDVVISDYSLPRFNPLEALELFNIYKRNYRTEAVFVLVAGNVSEEIAVKAIQSGADDYILKDRLKRLPSAIEGALEKNRLKEQGRQIEEEKHYLLDILQKSLHEIYVFDPETLLFEYVNEEALNNLGYTKEEMANLTPADVIYGFDIKEYKMMLSAIEQSPKGRIYERFAVRKDKTTYPVQFHMQVILQGKTKKILANLLDITEAKEHEQQKELALFIQDCFYEKRSLEASLTIILKELCLRSSVTAGEVWASDFAGESIKRYAYWNEVETNLNNIGAFFAQKARETGEPVLVNLEETVLPIEEFLDCKYKSAMAFPIKSGKEITAVIVMYDYNLLPNKKPLLKLKDGVQDKLAGNIKRKKTEEELQMIFELSPDILAILGKDGYIRKINPAIHNLLGYSIEEMLSMSFVELIHPEDLPVLEEWRSRRLAENEVSYYECRWLAKNGKYRCFSWSVTPFLKEELHFVVGRDITAHKEQVKAISAQNEKLEEIAWEQSHIVRAPLTRLMACVEYLNEEEEDDKKRILESIRSSANELDEILKSIVTKTEAVSQDEEY